MKIRISLNILLLIYNVTSILNSVHTTIMVSSTTASLTLTSETLCLLIPSYMMGWGGGFSHCLKAKTGIFLLIYQNKLYNLGIEQFPPTNVTQQISEVTGIQTHNLGFYL